ncbi:MAG: aspartate aminotransferase family protein [Bacillota bacterium]|jgi:putrescine aminotransferase
MVDVKKVYPEFITVDEALSLKTKEDRDRAIELQLKHNNQYRTQLALDIGASEVPFKAEGAYFWDYEGNKHLDFIGSVGPALLGLNNPFIIDAIKKYLDSKTITMDPLMIHQVTAAFSHNMAMLTPYCPRTVICCGGAEANETLLKMLKIASYKHKTGKKRMLTTINAFHGKTAATVNLGGKAKWRQYQGEDLPGHVHVPYGDWKAAEEELKKGDIIAFLCEPIQGEGGIVVPPDDYLPKMREICTKYDAYFCLDEVQAGSGRTGYLWAHQYYEGLQPDAWSFAKAISGSLMPVGGVQASEELYMAAYGSEETCFHHTATYQDNNISGVVALASLQYIIENDVPGLIRENSKYLVAGLEKLQAKYPNVIKEIRGRGYMRGLEYGANKAGEYYTVPVCATLASKYRVHTMFSINDERICRCYPNVAATKEDFDWFLRDLENAIKDVLAQMGD